MKLLKVFLKTRLRMKSTLSQFYSVNYVTVKANDEIYDRPRQANRFIMFEHILSARII